MNLLKYDNFSVIYSNSSAVTIVFIDPEIYGTFDNVDIGTLINKLNNNEYSTDCDGNGFNIRVDNHRTYTLSWKNIRLPENYYQLLNNK